MKFSVIININDGFKCLKISFPNSMFKKKTKMYHLSMEFTIFNKRIYVKCTFIFITYHTFNSFQMFYVPTHKEKEYVIVNYLFRIYVIEI